MSLRNSLSYYSNRLQLYSLRKKSSLLLQLPHHYCPAMPPFPVSIISIFMMILELALYTWSTRHTGEENMSSCIFFPLLHGPSSFSFCNCLRGYMSMHLCFYKYLHEEAGIATKEPYEHTDTRSQDIWRAGATTVIAESMYPIRMRKRVSLLSQSEQ